MKYFRILLFSVFGFLAFGPVTDAFGDDHGDHKGEPQDGWHCAICDLDFDSAEEMDEHAEEAGHLKDRGKPHRDHDGEPQDSWHCAICDLDFDSAEEMDAHAEEAGHLKDRGKPHGKRHGKPHRDHDGDDHGDHGDHHGEEHHEGPPIFEDVDANADGVIDRKEARAEFGDDEDFDETFDRVDTNDDGVVDKAEFAAEIAAQAEEGDFGDVNTSTDGA